MAPRFGSTIRKGDCYNVDTYTYYPVVIIGAGESGIAAACQLKEKLGFDQFRVFDRQGGIGGTWFINRYPGVACDVPAAFYSFSFAQNPNWTSLYPQGREIVEYLQGVCEDYGVIDKIQCNTDVESCIWNEDEGVWDLVLQHLVRGAGDLTTAEKKEKTEKEGKQSIYIGEERIKAKVVISAVGGLVEPKQWPEKIPGRDKFKGEIFHSARWKYDVNLKDKDVIVVGTGCSAAQFVPKLRKDYGAKSVTQIMRSPPWVVPKLKASMNPETAVWLNKNIPYYQKAFRFLIAMGSENEWWWFTDSKAAEQKRRTIEKQLMAHMKKIVPEKYHEILTPDYDVGCKRRIFDYEWFRSLRDENVELTIAQLTSIQEDTVTMQGISKNPGIEEKISKPADVIILANGFETTKWLHPLDIKGRGGIGLHDVYAERGGPQMYNGCAMDEFPNFFTIFGPNTATGHSSVILASENMIQMTLQLIKPILGGQASTVEVKKAAEIAYTQDIQKQCKKTVWHMGGCSSWYFDATSKDHWNSTVFPYSQVWFWFRCTYLTWSDWKIEYTPQGKREKRNQMLKRAATLIVLAAAIVKARRAGLTLSNPVGLVRGLCRMIALSGAETLRYVGQRV